MKDFLKKVVKGPMFLILSVIVILSTMSACILSINAVKPSSETNQYTVIFPTYTDSIEKLEYSIGTIGVNSSSKKAEWKWDDWKNVDGELSAKVTNQNKIKFLVKFKEGYSDYSINNVKIKSDAQGENNTAGLVVYEMNENNEITTRKPYGNEKINSKTSYSSEEISINQDQTLYFGDIIPNSYSLTLNIPVSEEIFDVYYDTDNGAASQKQTKKMTSERKENNYVYTLKNIQYGTVVNFDMRLKDKYSQLEDKNFDIFPKESNDHFLKADNSSGKFAWEAKENSEINFDVTDKIEITSNKYNIKNTTGKALYYKENNSEEAAKVLQQGESLNIEHGTACTFYTQDGDILVYDGNKGMNKNEENEKNEYCISDITDNHTIDIKKESANNKFAVTFPQNEGLNFVDTDGNDLSKKATVVDSNAFIFVEEGKPFEFKVKEVPGYTNYIKNLELTENSRPIVADETGTYTLKSVNENITVLADDTPEVDEHEIRIARNAIRNLTMTIKNISTNPEEEINPVPDDSNELYDIYKVSHGNEISIEFKSKENFNLTNMKLFNNGEEVSGGEVITDGTTGKTTAIWKFTCEKNMLLTVSGISRAPVSCTFNNNNGDTEIVYAKENETIDSDNFSSSYYIDPEGTKCILEKSKNEGTEFEVSYGSDVYLKLKSYILDKLNVTASNKEISSENGYYVIKNVTERLKIEETAINDKTYTVTIFTNLGKYMDFSSDKEGDCDKKNYTSYITLQNNNKTSLKVAHNNPCTLYFYWTGTDEPAVKETISDESDNADEKDKNKSVKLSKCSKCSKNEGYKDNYYSVELDKVQSDKFLFFYDNTHSKNIQKQLRYDLVATGKIPFQWVDDETLIEGTQFINARNITSKYTLVKGNNDDEDYDINFDEYATDMDRDTLKIKTKAGKEYNMNYRVIGSNSNYNTSDNSPHGYFATPNSIDSYINSGTTENLSGCDRMYRYEAPKKLNIKLDYGEKCNKNNFVGFQFDAVEHSGNKIEDIFGLRKKFSEELHPSTEASTGTPTPDYNDPYINTKADRGKFPTDSLRGFFQIHWIYQTLSMGVPLDAKSNYSIFNTRKFSYGNMTFYSLLLRADDLNYVANDRDVTPTNKASSDKELGDSTNSVLLYNKKYSSSGNVPYREYYRSSWADILEGIPEKDNRAEKINEFNEKNFPYKLVDNKNEEDPKLYIAGKRETNPSEIESGNMSLNIRANTLLVYKDNLNGRYEDDICLKSEFNSLNNDNQTQNVRKYGGLYKYPNILVHKDSFKKFTSMDNTYSKEGNAMFKIRSLDSYKEIQIKPIFSGIDYSEETSYAKEPTMTLPIDTQGIKFYKCNGTVPGEQIISSKIAVDTNDPNSWYHEKNNDGKYKSAWCYKFIIKPDEEYNFIPGSVKNFPEGYSVLSYEERNSDVFGKYYIYYVKNLLTTENIINVPEVEKYKYTVSFSDGYTTFRDKETNEQLLKKELTIGSEFVFKTEPQAGCQSNETLIINVGNDTFKVTSDATDITGNSRVKLPKGTIIERSNNASSTENLYTIKNIQENFSIFSTRERSYVPITLTYDSSVYYKDISGKYMTMKVENGDKKLAYVDTADEVLNENIELTVDYSSNFYFTIEEREGFDPLSTIITANNIKLDYENGKYSIKNITSETTVKIESSAKISYKVYFTNHEGVTFKSIDGKNLVGENTVSYGSDLSFKINLSEEYSNSENCKVMVEYSTEGKKPAEIPKDKNNDGNDTDRYILKNIQENVRIYVEGLEHNTYQMKLYNSTGISYYDKYGQEKYMSSGEFIEKTVYHGEDFSFKIVAEEGYDISEIKVYSKQEKSDLRKQLLPSNGVYTIEKPSDNCTITVENTKKSVYNIEIRTTSGAKCLDDNGNILDSNLTVNHGDSFGFTIALDKAYDHSTPIVTLKGSINTISPVDGKYIISNITENKIIEITGIKKNTYKATFKETEGVIYKNGKNKPFTGSLDAEDGETLNFKITLMDAYDKSSPIVLLNNSKPIAESAGVYSVDNVSSDLEISVENVYKNPEEITMEDVNNVPDKVSTELDISRVVEATKTYMNLSDEEKAQVTNLADLNRAQQEAGVINHKSGDISVTGLDWNIKVVVDKLTGDQEKVNYMNGKIDRREVIYLYDIYLIDLLTDEVYEIPYGNKVTVTIPAPDLSGYKNEVVVHEKSNGNIEYIDMNITDGTARFEATSFSLFGIAAKKIPNYSDPSDTKIHVSDLVDNEVELQALLGEGVSSQLGDLTENKNDFDILGGEEGVLAKGKSGLAALYDWILNHELLSVIIILIMGSLLIFLIILKAKKENTSIK